MPAIIRHPGWKQNVLPLAAGLALAQLIGTLYVWDSNLRLYDQTRALTAAGWFAVPHGPVVASLKSLQAAIWGGLFYTLSVGAGLALATWGLGRLRKTLFANSRLFSWGLAAAWLTLIGAVNTKGFAWFPSLFAAGIPLVTAGVACRAADKTPRDRSPWLWCLPALTLIGLTGLWSTQLNEQLFTTIRDHVLLSNPVGRSVNDFYYRYTLYAAEAFKGFHQKSIRTCRLETGDDVDLHKRLETTLAKWDVLTVDAGPHGDVTIRGNGDQLVLASGRGDTTRMETDVFFKDIDAALQAFALATDRQAPFRRLIFSGVLIGFPVLLYLVVYGLLRCWVGLLCKNAKATWITSGLCLLVGVLLFMPMLAGRDRQLTPAQLAQALQAGDPSLRVAALRQAEKQALDIGRLTDYQPLLTSDRVVERYWLARVLALAQGPGAFRDLLSLINDPHPNVVCQAYYALGQKGHRAAVAPIKARMIQSDHWYTQFYGYRAMRKLGWHQTQSKPAP